MLTKRGESYYLRLIVPADLRGAVGQGEIVRTLKTGQRREARSKEGYISANLNSLWKQIRRMKKTLELTQIKQIVNHWLEKQLEQYAVDKLNAPLWLTKSGTTEALGFLLDELSDRQVRLDAIFRNPESGHYFSDEDIIEQGAPPDGAELSACNEIASQILSEHNIAEIDDTSRLYLIRHVADALLKEIDAQKKVACSFFEQPQNKPEPVEAISIQEITAVQAAQTPAVSEVIDKYIAALHEADNASENSIEEYESLCRRFPLIMGDREIANYTRDDLRRFINIVKRLPPNFKKSPIYKGLSIDEILSMKADKTLSATTVNKYIDKMQSLFNWAEKDGIISSNPAEILVKTKVGRRNKGIKDRNRYTREDIQLMTNSLHHEDMENKFDKRPERFWVPLIAMFSGMRLNEVCQLQIDDIAQDIETGIWFFNVAEVEGLTSVKTAAGVRHVPIHPTLIKLGLLDYYNKIKDAGSPRVWPRLTKTKKGHSRRVAFWFNGDKDSPGFARRYVTKDPKKTFHSLRHSVRDEFKQMRADSGAASEIIGHEYEVGETKVYSDPLAIDIKMETLEKLDYGLDLMHLKPIADKLLKQHLYPV